MESIKKKYYKLSTAEFNSLVDSIRNSPDTLVLFNKQYYFRTDNKLYSLLLKLHDKQNEFDHLINAYSEFGQKQIIQSFLIEEIFSSNQIENVFSTKHDIFYLINEGIKTDDKNIRSITNAYSILLKDELKRVTSLKAIRDVYDELMKDNLNKEDKPDGKYFRKDRVFINDGIRNVYQGFYPEEKIIEAIKEFISVYNDNNLDVYLRLAITHFMFETIHPFYDGNGRMGRLLLSMNMYENTHSYLSFVLSKAILDNKSKYYKLFEEVRDDREMGIINSFVYEFCLIILNYISEVVDNLKYSKQEIDSYQNNAEYSLSENKVLMVLSEAKLLSDFGVSIDELIKYAGVSKRTVMYTIKKLKERNKLDYIRINKNHYYKLK